MLSILKPVLITFLSIAILAFWVPAVNYSNWASLLIASIILTFLQAFVRPVLKILFLPINIVTLGLFSWVVSVFILWLTMVLAPGGFHVDQVVLMGHQLGPIFSLIFVSFALGVIQTIIDLVF